MHYILLSFILKLGEKNLDYMKLEDMRRAVVPETNIYEQVIGPSIGFETPISDITQEESSDIVINPYVDVNNFAELLPEDELNDFIDSSEQQGPAFLESIKNRLIRLTEWSEKSSSMDAILGGEIEGPTFLESIKNKILGLASSSKDSEMTEEIIAIKAEAEAAAEKARLEAEEVKKEQERLAKIEEDKKRAKETFERMKKEKEDAEKARKEKIKADIEALFDSELNQFLKDRKIKSYEELLSGQLKLEDEEEPTFIENKDYENFLKEKETYSEKNKNEVSGVDLLKNYRLDTDTIPKIIPREKELTNYNKTEVPQELLEERSFKNRHIPKITIPKDDEDLLEYIVENGMIPEFKALVRKKELINAPLKNQYNLITFTTKNKQYDMMRYLISIGVDVNNRDSRLNNAVIIATQNNDIQALKILKEASANLDVLDILKRTPLIYSIEKGQDDVAMYLIENGADYNIPNNLGEGTLSISERLGEYDIRNKIIKKIKEDKDNKENNKEIKN